MSKQIKAAEGFDIYGVGPLANTYPWTVQATAHNGAIQSTTGKFGGNKLRFASTDTSAAIGTSYGFGSTALMTRAAGPAVLGVSGWIFIDSTTTAGSYSLISVGSSSNTATKFYTILGLTRSAGGDLTLTFPTNINNITSSPVTFPVVAGSSYWVDIKLGWYSGNLTASYEVNSGSVSSNVAVSWGTDNFVANSAANQIHFWSASTYTWGIDDMIIQSSSSNEPTWTYGTAPTANSLDSLGPRRIYPVTVTGNGSVNQWESDNVGVPNYQAATNGTNKVSTQTSGAIDLYTVSTDANILDVTAVVYRGKGLRPGNVIPVAKSGGNVTAGTVTGANSTFLGVLDNNNGAQWTPSDINSGEFGIKGY